MITSLEATLKPGFADCKLIKQHMLSIPSLLLPRASFVRAVNFAENGSAQRHIRCRRRNKGRLFYLAMQHADNRY